MRPLLVFLAACCASAPAAQHPHPTSTGAPVAARHPHTVRSPNGDREDPYYWLRDDTRKSPEVLGYLQAEADYMAKRWAPVKPLEDTLLGEMKSHVKEDDQSVPVLDDGYWYYARYSAGQEQPVYARRKGAMTAPEEVVLDGNALAKGQPFFAFGGHAVSRDGAFVAWADDLVGRRQYTLHIKEVVTGRVLPVTRTNIAGSIVWANDGTLFYTGKDSETLREDRVYHLEIGSAAADVLVFQEKDPSYYVSVGATKSHRFIQIGLEATTNTETRLIDADAPRTAPRVAIPRRAEHLYALDHLDGKFVIRTNDHAKNFRIVEVAETDVADPAKWRDVIPARPETFLENFTVSRHFVAVTARTAGLAKVEVVVAGGAPFFIESDEPTFTMGLADVPDPDATRVRYTYMSLVTPASVLELDPTTRARTVLKEQEVPAYDRTKYASEFLHARASDGTQVPISVVYRKDTKRDGTAPVLVYGYGSYGISMPPWFDANRASLLDRGWVFAIAHIRGGQEMGRAWYDDGHLMHKKNTFTDFTAATEHLVAQKLGARDQMFALGGSAGGLLMGAILNLRPDLYRGVVAVVPFVDVVTTMLDESIPLTTNEFDEWGNPKQKAAYDYMLSYSPYDNVAATAYPSIFVKSGLWDSQVQYYEPTKWVAKLRATKTDENLLLFDVDMNAGHGGKSGRFDRLHDAARQYAFLIHVHETPDARAKR